MGFAIGTDDAVETEVPVGRAIAEVAAVGEEFSAVVGFLVESLVDPVPNKAPLEMRILLDGGPVVLQVADAVAHRVGIFAEDQRAIRIARGVIHNLAR